MGSSDLTADAQPGERARRITRMMERVATDARIEAWLEAMRWRRAVSKVVVGAGLTFKQWLVLDGTRQVQETMGEAAIQNEIASWLELDRATVSQVLHALEARRLLGREIDITGRAWLIGVDAPGLRLLQSVAARVEESSVRGAALRQGQALRERKRREGDVAPWLTR